MLRGWLARGQAAADVWVVEPAEAASVPVGVRKVAAAVDLPASFRPEIVVLAVKPQKMDEALAPLTRYRDPQFLSIAAGRTLAYFERALGQVAVVRAMPNLPAAVGRGISVAVANPRVSEEGRKLCDGLLASVGEVAWTDDESQLDTVTALSGSGPAYVFLLVECLAEAGAALGLPPDLARRLARATITGAGELLYRSTEEPGTLRENVTSPAGTTFAALQILRAPDGLAPLVARAVAAAAARSRELAG